MAAPRARPRPGCSPSPAGPRARSTRARVLRRLHAIGARAEAGRAPRYDQEPDVHRPRAAARSARRAADDTHAMDDNALHELTAPYALDALDADERRAYEAHPARCDRCRDDLAELSD